jgi:WD40 repeat protein
MCVADCVGHTKIPTRIVDWKERLVTASADGMVREWDWQTGREMKSMRVHDGINPAVRAMEFLGDSDQMVTAGMDGKVKLWDYKSERCTEELLADQRVVWIGRKIGEDWFAITGRVVEDVQYLKIFKIGS